MTQIEYAQKGIVTKQIEEVALKEKRSPEFIMEGLIKGTIVIPKNINHQIEAMGVGKGLRTKVNANIGTSSDIVDINAELLKVKAAIEAKADSIMDLSTGGDLDFFRRKILHESTIVVGNVPIYQAAVEVATKEGSIVHLTKDYLLKTIEKQAQDGIDYMTLHCGVTQSSLERLINQGRIEDIVSRGGSFLAVWMLYHEKENPLYEYFDDILEIVKKYDVTISLGDGFRPGAIADATDRAQIEELIILGELHKKALKAGVQSMIEGPGHVPIDQIITNAKIEEAVCEGAPFYVLGPVVTDIAPGYDHITSAIGGALMASYGADMLCYVTKAEHVRLPNPEDVREGVIVTRIAAHAADIAKKIPGAIDWDIKMSKARKNLDWNKMIELSIDPNYVKSQRESSMPKESDVCTMCGKFCAIKLLNKALRNR
ncbi:MAG: phosphomethylpyrimidine synthase ThiC [Desulfurella sp.]|uniref:phosphomethylpyrimidine synthase ThiC n=1 Tax=Desulfurella TaxID=33001 RepID=UPI000CC55DE9|nr:MULTISPECIES: phosphomethylpyrimidine synthase ThiC [Desulfurella]PMP68411.1 MAG: phosphomethylpyrimidine synthase [Desulfurella multipotens]PMP93540.1 MAG: phosphomethylpyrimidine synthase [Desulfurella sp.]HEX13290.1 phosphomethylpyrimidine synthase ThiC [Desulfurella acetivorans]